MPDPSARQWFINVVKLFSSDSTSYDFIGHARKLNIANPKDLVDCLDKTTSSTARQITRLLYTRKQLLEMTGPEIPKEQRQAIIGMSHFDRSIIININLFLPN